jgi:hypothetical protein
MSFVVSHMKKREDLNDVMREESSRGRKRPINTAAINEKAVRRDAVLRIFRRGTREDLRALLKTWGYTEEESKRHLPRTTPHAISNLLSLGIRLLPLLGGHACGPFVDVNCETFGQFLDPILFLTFQLSDGHWVPLSGAILPLLLSLAD